MKGFFLGPFQSGPVFQKKLQKLIILAPVHIFLFPIQGKGLHQESEKFEKSLFFRLN
jgi:hypothetical protein